MSLKRIKASSLITFFFLVILLLLSSPGLTAQNRPFTLGKMIVQTGESLSGFLEVPAGLDPAAQIPVTVINGQKPGRVLAAVAGVHPYEYPPILALYRLKEMIKPEELSGTLILVHIANLPAFQKRTIYYNPFDWKNLNRVFPGDLHGTQSQRIAAVLTREVVDRAEALIDLHCGDGNEALIPYTYWMLSGDSQLDSITREMAVVFGLKHIIIDNTRAQDLQNSKYLGNTAIVRKRPAITTESGYLGRVEEEAIAANVTGVLNVMKYFKMIPGQPRRQTEPVWIEKYEVIYSSHDGLFYPRAGMGDYVRAGEVVGTITDYHGNILEEQRAPFTGILLYIIGTPPCNKGEPLFEVGKVKE
ncbi:MAG: succinylglutamate desuccinylase/aspartoacylase family protein [Candidatus Saccharicenans sp.]|uniref:succinylglutamate desuccinylase/aspartoacylase family protein n=1 Tax=Candidatus Saccharicenans sp. TaxID=2819258 RepID=UPI0040496683